MQKNARYTLVCVVPPPKKECMLCRQRTKPTAHLAYCVSKWQFRKPPEGKPCLGPLSALSRGTPSRCVAYSYNNKHSSGWHTVETDLTAGHSRCSVFLRGVLTAAAPKKKITARGGLINYQPNKPLGVDLVCSVECSVKNEQIQYDFAPGKLSPRTRQWPMANFSTIDHGRTGRFICGMHRRVLILKNCFRGAK